MVSQKLWIGLLSILGIGVALVMALLAGVLFGLSYIESNATPTPTPALTLPTAVPPTSTPGPPAPAEVVFTAEAPVLGYSDCKVWGVYGQVQAETLDTIEVVVWGDTAELLTLDSVDNDGRYLIEIAGEPASRRIWVQVYRGDVPVSDALALQIQTDCQTGFQVYEVDWRIQGE